MDLNPTILILDDAADTLCLIGTCLRGHGYRVMVAANGDEGLKLAAEHRPELVVTDLLMPGSSGFRVLDRLKNDFVYKPKVIMISAMDAPLHRAYAADCGADDFLPKPFVLQQLLDTVCRLCPLTAPVQSPDTPTDAMVRV